MKSLPVLNESLKCNSCVTTKQMKASKYCSLTIVKDEDQFIPKCFVDIKDTSQAERNFLMCPTYNLGIYSACKTCPLDCHQNLNPSKKSPIADVLNMLGGLFGVGDEKKREIVNAIERLNNPEFKGVYQSLENISKNLGNAINGNVDANADMSRKIIELETNNLKKQFNGLIEGGKISKEEVENLKKEINTSTNIENLKSIIGDLKNNYAKKTQ